MLPQDLFTAKLTADRFTNSELVMDTEGAVHVAWMMANQRYYYLRRGADGVWSNPDYLLNPEQISDDYRALYEPGQIGLAVDRAGIPHVAWVGTDAEIYYGWRNADGIWSVKRSLSSHSNASPHAPRVATDDLGVVHVIWTDSAPGNTKLWYTRYANSAWSRALTIAQSPGGMDAQIISGPGDSAYMVWDDHDPDNAEIYFAQSISAEDAGDSTIAQVATLPNTLSGPTLSFLYQFRRNWLDTGAWFQVTLHDGLTATTLFSTTTTTVDWTHRWFDLSPWAGQIITLTFNAHQEAGGPSAWAYLDEVTVGSGTYPDLWAAAPIQVAAPGEIVTFTLAYGNRGEAPARGATLTATLPTGLTFVAADPPPSATGSTVTWNLGDLPAGPGLHTVTLVAAVSVAAPPGFILSADLAIASATSEIETANNTATLQVYVGGARRYLPLALAGSR